MGKISIDVKFDPEFLDGLKTFGDSLGSRLISQLMPVMTPIYEDAKRRWPVKTGHSRDSLALGARIKPGHVKVGFYNTAPYTMFIRGWEVRDDVAPHKKKRPFSDELFLEYLKKYPIKNKINIERSGESAWVVLVSGPFKAKRKEVINNLEDTIADEIGIPRKKRRKPRVKEDPKL